MFKLIFKIRTGIQNQEAMVKRHNRPHPLSPASPAAAAAAVAVAGAVDGTGADGGGPGWETGGAAVCRGAGDLAKIGFARGVDSGAGEDQAAARAASRRVLMRPRSGGTSLMTSTCEAMVWTQPVRSECSPPQH